MTNWTLPVAFALALAACGPPDIPRRTVIIGATLMAPNRAPLENSVVVVEAGLIRAVGAQRDVPIPAGSEKVSAAGQFLMPAEGGVVEPGQAASFNLHIDPQGEPVRRMRQGAWITP